MLPRGDGALADDEGDREDENGRGEAEADDEPGGALFGFVVAALRSVSLRRNAVDDERVRAGTTLQKKKKSRPLQWFSDGRERS